MSKFFNAEPLPNLFTAGRRAQHRRATAGTVRPRTRRSASWDASITPSIATTRSSSASSFRATIPRWAILSTAATRRFPGYPPTETSVRKPQNYAANYRRVISPHMVNSFTAGRGALPVRLSQRLHQQRIPHHSALPVIRQHHQPVQQPDGRRPLQSARPLAHPHHDADSRRSQLGARRAPDQHGFQLPLRAGERFAQLRGHASTALRWSPSAARCAIPR